MTYVYRSKHKLDWCELLNMLSLDKNTYHISSGGFEVLIN